MTYRLKDRNRPIPNGISAIDASVNYRAPQFASFDVQWRGVQQARLGNPGLTKRYKLPTDDQSCMDFVDSYLGQKAHELGYTDYYTTSQGGANAGMLPPSRKSASAGRLASVAAGVKTIYEWITSKEEAVAGELANKRAEVCSKCPLNQKGGLADFFEIKAAAAITSALETKRGWNLSTKFDDKLGVCQGCFCVNALSVWCPLAIKKKHLSKEAFDALVPECWVKTEK